MTTASLQPAAQKLGGNRRKEWIQGFWPNHGDEMASRSTKWRIKGNLDGDCSVNVRKMVETELSRDLFLQRREKGRAILPPL